MADVKDKAEEKVGSAPEAVAGSPATEATEGGSRVKQPRVRVGRAVPFGIVHIRATFNNTIISISDSKGGIIAWSTSGRAGFKGSRKSTAFAASVVAQEVSRQAVARGMQEVEVRVQGPGAGRESAIRAIQSAGLNVSMIKDVTPMPHNGCRPRKRRRV
ncbi:MAG: 30S ribosomal protein S11 [bacterium]